MTGSLLSSQLRCYLLRGTFSDHPVLQSKAASLLTLHCIFLFKTPVTFWNDLMHFYMGVFVKCTGCGLQVGLDSSELVPTISPALRTTEYISRPTLNTE